MFMTIKTNGATHIAIYVPNEGAEKSLPAIANMFEQNATFINQAWREVSVVRPEIGITLGNVFKNSDNEEEIIITNVDTVIDEDFQLAAPHVFTSNRKAVKRVEEENKRLQNELQYVKQELEALKAKAAELVED